MLFKRTVKLDPNLRITTLFCYMSVISHFATPRYFTSSSSLGVDAARLGLGFGCIAAWH